MAERPKKNEQGHASRGATSEQDSEIRTAEREARALDDSDPREEEGWTQPESSAQKGAERDEG